VALDLSFDRLLIMMMSVWKCFLLFSQYVAITSLNSLACTYEYYVRVFVLLMGKQAICYEVRTGLLDVIQMKFMFERRSIAQAVSH